MIINNEQTIYEDEDYEVEEICPNCDEEVLMLWNPVRNGYQTECPYCGERLMLCDLCRNRYDGGLTGVFDCDYSRSTHSCKMMNDG